jgi:hypothetical protein
MYDSFSNIQLPFFDISNYSFDCKEDIQEILKQHLEKAFEVIDHVLYRAIIVKLDNSNYKLIFLFNHLIFDGGSVLFLDEQIENILRGARLDREEENEKIDYYDYTYFLNNLKYENISLEKYLHIHEYLEYVEKVVKNNKANELADDLFEIDLSILNDRSKDIYNEILFLSYAKFMGNLYGIDKVPLLFYSYGRNYKDGNFRNVIGTFQDTIPVLFHLEKNRDTNFEYLLENFLDYREYVRNSNLNFTNFVLKKYLQGVNNLRLLACPFKFNSQFVSSERYKIMSTIRPSNSSRWEKFAFDQIIFEMKVFKDIHSDKLIVRFLHNSILEIHRLKEMFFKEFQDVAQCFDGG